MKLDFALFFLAIAQLAVVRAQELFPYFLYKILTQHMFSFHTGQAAPKLKTRASADEVASIGYAAQNGG